MARKAKLDILEVQGQPSPAEAEPSPPAEPAAATQGPTRWFSKKRVVMSLIAVGFCSIAVGTAFFWMTTGKSGMNAKSERQRQAVVTDVAQPNVVNLENFVIDYREGEGKVRIAMFGLAVELNGSATRDAVENHVEFRRAIYALSKKKTAASFLSLEQRDALKREIAAELEKQLGQGVVKAIYFTKFYVL